MKIPKPRKKPELIRRKMVVLRLTETEWKRLQQSACEKGVTISKWLREKLP